MGVTNYKALSLMYKVRLYIYMGASPFLPSIPCLGIKLISSKLDRVWWKICLVAGGEGEERSARKCEELIHLILLVSKLFPSLPLHPNLGSNNT